MEEVSNNGGPWHARMNSRAPRQKERRRRYIYNFQGSLQIKMTEGYRI